MGTALRAGLVMAALASWVAAASTPGQSCAAAKLKAAARKHQSKVKCYQKALSKGLPVEPACLGKAETKFAEAFARAETRGGCATTNDAGDIELLVDSCVGALVAALPATTSTTTTTTTSSTTTTVFSGGCFSIGVPCGTNCEGFGECFGIWNSSQTVCADTRTAGAGICALGSCQPGEVCAAFGPSGQATRCYRPCPPD